MRRSSGASLIAVVDTNLFVSGTILKRGAPFALLEAWRRREFVVLLSAPQDAELRDVLARPKFLTDYRLTETEIDQFFEDLARLTIPVPLHLPLPVEVRDTKDEAVLAAALGGRAGYVVTGDNDLLVLAGDPRLGALKIVNARAFLTSSPPNPAPAIPSRSFSVPLFQFGIARVTPDRMWQRPLHFAPNSDRATTGAIPAPSPASATTG
jgi:putative PIN family toxin of toxin-antitoxin system